MTIITTTKEMRPRDSADFYPTPLATAYAALKLLPKEYTPLHILDPGAGSGIWGLAARRRWGYSRITGVELRNIPAHSEYSHWFQGSLLSLPSPRVPVPPFRDAKAEQRAYEQYRFDLWAYQQAVWTWPRVLYDCVIGNPPYKYAEAFVRLSLEHTVEGGYVVFLLRLAFLEGQERGAGLWKEYPPKQVAVCSQRPSFTGDGKTDATAYAVFVWQKGYSGSTSLTWLGGY